MLHAFIAGVSPPSALSSSSSAGWSHAAANANTARALRIAVSSRNPQTTREHRWARPVRFITVNTARIHTEHPTNTTDNLRKRVPDLSQADSTSSSRPTAARVPAAGVSRATLFSVAALASLELAAWIPPAFAADAADKATTSPLKDAFTSIPASLAHPATMWVLLGTALYAFYLGWQSRQIRSVDAERRKELVKSKVTQRHFTTASALFTVMTLATFSGMANTFARTGKLFPGPHLYAGLGLVSLMSVMSAMVPYMQQGKGWAKDVHFALAFGAIALFGWQAQSGMIIVGKLLHWN